MVDESGSKESFIEASWWEKAEKAEMAEGHGARLGGQRNGWKTTVSEAQVLQVAEKGL